jgi:limonene-1,2-epoxide hydrolase
VSTPGDSTRHAVLGLFAAIESRDLRRIARALSPGCSWQNVPHPAVVGAADVVALLAPAICWSDRVRWEITTASFGAGLAWVERADRFWIDGDEHTVRCNGVFTVDTASEMVTGVRDHVDLGEWRSRIGPVYERMAGRSALDVVARHLAGVHDRDVAAATADHALDAVVEHDGRAHRGWFEIADHIEALFARLHGRRLTVEAPFVVDGSGSGEEVEVRWSIADDRRVAAGRSRYLVERGRICRQVISAATGRR